MSYIETGFEEVSTGAIMFCTLVNIGVRKGLEECQRLADKRSAGIKTEKRPRFNQSRSAVLIQDHTAWWHVLKCMI